MIENETPTLSDVIKEAIEAKLLDLHVSMPAKIEKYDNATQKADVKPLLRKKYKLNNGTVEIPVIPNVPVQFPSADNGNAYIHFPIKSGDLGIIVCCERSIDNWLSGTGQVVNSDDPRHHSFSDAIFIPGVRPFSAALENTTEDEVIVQRNENCVQKFYDNGKIEIKGQESEINYHPDGKREFLGGDMSVTFFPNGTLTVQGATKELLTVIDSWMDHIINDGYMLTCFGATGWITYTKLLLLQDREDFQTLMNEPPGL